MYLYAVKPLMDNSTDHIISLGDAVRLSGPLAFNVMVKPVGALCNLDCTYCYYLDKSRLYNARPAVMSEDMMKRLVSEGIDSVETGEITFEWHGGEPLLAGIEFFRKVVEHQNKCSTGKRIYNTIQTNGTLITSEWADFFRENNFLVGISIDGPKDIHDRFRKDRGGAPAFDRVMSGLSCLQQAGVEFNTMTAVSCVSEGRGGEVYQFLKSIGSRYMQFMPVLEHLKYADSVRPVITSPSDPEGRLAPWSVSAEGFGRFMCDIFDDWIREDVGECFVNLFDATLAGWCGVNPGLCVYNDVCGANLVVEHNGDVYPCDHFVYEDHRLGNIGTDSLASLAASWSQSVFGSSKRNGLPRQCLECEYLRLCNGECPKHRFGRTVEGQPGLNALCEGYRMFFRHSAPYMIEMKRFLDSSLPPSMIMASFRG